jgi:hypothetical protein
MTEQEWLKCSDPELMLALLQGKTNDRKLRLFAIACCHRIWDLLPDERSRNAVLIAEQYVDGLADRDTVGRVLRMAPSSEWPGSGPEIYNWKLVTTGIAADMTDPRTYVWLTAEPNVEELTSSRVAAKWAEEGQRFVSASVQAQILHEVFGNLFEPVTLEPRWLTSTVIDLAQAIYQEKAFDRMGILGDALMDAGCDNQEIIVHCRGDGAHVRGCWVVDLILGKS